MRKKLVRLIVVAVSFLVIPASGLAADIHHVSPGQSIQDAIDAASDGDTVQVEAGTYHERITLKSGVIVQGSGASVTIIDATGLGGSVVTAININSSAKIDGFTITGGVPPMDGPGGGIYLKNSSLTISNNTITKNDAGNGGGIYLDSSSPIISNNTITENFGYYGGGIACYYPISATITNNRITRNNSYYGGGIGCFLSSPIITNNTITGNSATFGSGIACLESSPIITNNTITGATYGAGIGCYYGSSPIITNNTITDNYAGGIQCLWNAPSSPIITNSIIWTNGDDLNGCSATYSDIEDGDAGTGNIQEDPLFVDPTNGDYHLQKGSPCINAGDNAAVPPGLTTDFEGDPRIVGGTVDMGADEVVLDGEGPLTTNLVATPNLVPMGTNYTITATVDDTDSGGSIIDSADCSMDGGSTWDHPMEAEDLSFDQPTEEVLHEMTAGSPGVLTVCARGTDEAGNTGDPECIFVVVYDPNGGFVTGGGWFVSPIGAYEPDSSLTGKATFGFVSKYHKGAKVPTGQTEFHFQVANLNFHSSSYDWLVVTGKNYAMFKGQGTINGEGEYQFMLWAGDGDPDTFRIKIWEEDEIDAVETVIYDNGFDQEISGGSIVIHAK